MAADSTAMEGTYLGFGIGSWVAILVVGVDELLLFFCWRTRQDINIAVH
jgi:hypothetical protein